MSVGGQIYLDSWIVGFNQIDTWFGLIYPPSICWYAGFLTLVSHKYKI